MMLTKGQWRFLQNNYTIRNFDFLALEQSHFYQTLHEGIVAGDGGNSSPLAGPELIEGRHAVSPSRDGRECASLLRRGATAGCRQSAVGTANRTGATEAGSRCVVRAPPSGSPNPVRQSPRPHRP